MWEPHLFYIPYHLLLLYIWESYFANEISTILPVYSYYYFFFVLNGLFSKYLTCSDEQRTHYYLVTLITGLQFDKEEMRRRIVVLSPHKQRFGMSFFLVVRCTYFITHKKVNHVKFLLLPNQQEEYFIDLLLAWFSPDGCEFSNFHKCIGSKLKVRTTCLRRA